MHFILPAHLSVDSLAVLALVLGRASVTKEGKIATMVELENGAKVLRAAHAHLKNDTESNTCVIKTVTDHLNAIKTAHGKSVSGCNPEVPATNGGGNNSKISPRIPVAYGPEDSHHRDGKPSAEVVNDTTEHPVDYFDDPRDHKPATAFRVNLDGITDGENNHCVKLGVPGRRMVDNADTNRDPTLGKP